MMFVFAMVTASWFDIAMAAVAMAHSQDIFKNKHVELCAVKTVRNYEILLNCLSLLMPKIYGLD